MRIESVVKDPDSGKDWINQQERDTIVRRYWRCHGYKETRNKLENLKLKKSDKEWKISRFNYLVGCQLAFFLADI